MMTDRLSRQEWIIMETLWKKQPMFLSEIMDALANTLLWKRTTFQTYLKRLNEKGYIGFDEIRGSRSYYPLVTREACVQDESQQMISKMTVDSAKMFLACMIRGSGLDEQSGQELKSLIETLSQDMQASEKEQ